jgi:hypothetical protein
LNDKQNTFLQIDSELISARDRSIKEDFLTLTQGLEEQAEPSP